MDVNKGKMDWTKRYMKEYPFVGIVLLSPEYAIKLETLLSSLEFFLSKMDKFEKKKHINNKTKQWTLLFL